MGRPPAMVWVFALLAVVCCTLAGSVAADNTYQVAVPQVVASQLNRLVSDGQYEAVRLQVKQYCADTMDVKNVRTTSSAVNSTLSPVAQTYTYTMENCHIHERVQGTEYVVELLNKGKVDIALGCGEDKSVFRGSTSCCKNNMNLLFASCDTEMPTLENSMYRAEFNQTGKAFEKMCNGTKLRVHQYCDFSDLSESENIGDWATMNCNQTVYNLEVEPCDSESDSEVRTVKQYQLEYLHDDNAKSCFGFSEEGLADPASAPYGFSGNRRVFVDIKNIKECRGETDQRILDEYDRRRREAEEQKKKKDEADQKKLDDAKAEEEEAVNGPAPNKTQTANEEMPGVKIEKKEASPTKPTGATCLEIQGKDAMSKSGVYTLTNPDTGDDFDAYCDMETDGGGWMLAFKQVQFASGSLKYDNKSLGSDDLLSEAFNYRSPFASLSAIGYGDPDRLLFKPQFKTNWFTTPVFEKYQEWDVEGSSRVCFYRPKTDKDDWVVSEEWESDDMPQLWQDVDIQLTTEVVKSLSAITIGRFRSVQQAPMCMEPHCSYDRHGRYNGGCQDGSAGVGNWLVFTRPKIVLPAKAKLDAALDRMAGHFTTPVNWYPVAHTGSWSFDSWGTVTADFNGDSLSDYARFGDIEIRLYISKGKHGKFWAPRYRFPHNLNFGFNEDQWSTLKPIDLNGDGRFDFIKANRDSMHIFIANGTNEECFYKDGIVPHFCYNYTSIKWEDPKAKFQLDTDGFVSHWKWYSHNIIYGDFNGDGLGDLARIGDKKLLLFISRGDGSFYTPIYHFPTGVAFSFNEWAWRTLKSADFNGDGKADFVKAGVTSFWTFLSRGSNSSCWFRSDEIAEGCFSYRQFEFPKGHHGVSFPYGSHMAWYYWGGRQALVADFNGDGMADIVRLQSSQFVFFISKGDGTYYNPIYPLPRGWGFGWNEAVWATMDAGDYDGDGKADIGRAYYHYNHMFFPRGDDEKCWKRDSYVSRSCMKITAYGYPFGWRWHNLYTPEMITGDFNGDGKLDLLNLKGAHYSHGFMSLLTELPEDKNHNVGQFYSPTFQYKHGWHMSGNHDFAAWGTMVADWNQDGMDDYARISDTHIHFFIAMEDGTFSSQYVNLFGHNFGYNENGWTTLRPMDVNGDGYPDIVRLHHTSTFVFLNNYKNKKEGNCFPADHQMDQDCFVLKNHWFVDGHRDAHNSHSRALVFGDFNNDKLDDFAILTNNVIKFYISRGDGYHYTPRYVLKNGRTLSGFNILQPGDHDGDGVVDLRAASPTTITTMFLRGTNETCWRTESNDMPQNCMEIADYSFPFGWHFSGVWDFGYYDQRALVLGDFNGDGKADIAKLSPTYIHFFIAKGDGQFYAPVYHFPGGWNFGWNEYYWATVTKWGGLGADFDGDGRTDIIRSYFTYNHGFFPRGSNEECWFMDSRHPDYMPSHCMKITAYAYPSTFHFGGGYHFAQLSTIVGDWNGDGIADFANVKHPTTAHLMIARGEDREPEDPNVGKFSGQRYHYRPDGYYYHSYWMHWTIKKGDFNGDGKMDYVQLWPHMMRFYISQGNGKFWHPMYHYPPGWNFGWHEWYWMTLDPIDVNGDGRKDIFRQSRHYNHGFISQGTNERCFHVDGWIPSDCFRITTFFYHRWMDGVWNARWPWTDTSITYGDFNGDGKEDFAHWAGNLIFFFISRGDGSFHTPYYYHYWWHFGWYQDWHAQLEGGDIDGDGRTDFTRLAPYGTFTFLSRGGDECWNRWQSQMPYHCLQHRFWHMPHGWFFWWSWTFGYWGRRLVVQGDFNGDGKMDWARRGSTYIHFFVSRGDGTWSTPVYRYPPYWNFNYYDWWWNTLPAGDYDGDGRSDIIMAGPYYNHGFFSRGSNHECWLTPTHKIFVPRYCMHVTYYHYPPHYYLIPWWWWQTWYYHHSTIQGDFNGDGKTDIVNVANPSYNMQFYPIPLKSEAEPLPPVGKFETPSFEYPDDQQMINDFFMDSWGTVVGDINGDGLSDYVRMGDKSMRLFISKGDGTYYTPVYKYPNQWFFGDNQASWTTLKAMDLNGDTKVDLVRLSPRSGRVFFSSGTNEDCWFMSGDIPASCFTAKQFSFKNFMEYSGSWSFYSRATIYGDFDMDGLADFARLGDTRAYFFLSNGDGTFRQPIYVYPHNLNFGHNQYYHTTMEGSDHDGDGKTDFYYHSFRHLYTFINRGGSDCFNLEDGVMDFSCFDFKSYEFPHGWHFSGGWHWNSRAVLQGDINGDEKDDIMHLGGPYVHIFISKGDGQYFSPIYYFPHGWNFGFNENYWTTMPSADYDGDERIDIIRSYYTYNHAFYPRGNDETCWHRNDYGVEHMPYECFQYTYDFYPESWSLHSSTTFNSHATVTGDFNGDGKADYANLRDPARNYQFLAE